MRLQHAPYPPTTSLLGGIPTVSLDIPITAVFLFLYILGAIAHMYRFRTNIARGHNFLISGFTFGFCMARIVTCIVRIVWATRPRNVSIGIAAVIFVQAGVVLLFAINLTLAQRIYRGWHPNSGWHPLGQWMIYAAYVWIVTSLTILIIATTQSFYTKNLNTKRIDRDLQLYGQTVWAVVSFIPIPVVIAAYLWPRKTNTEKFGTGRLRHKSAILLIGAALLCLGASFRAGTSYKMPRPNTSPAWYQSRACFYVFIFTVEIIVVALYAVGRIDQRFYVPDGSKGPGDYSKRSLQASSGDHSKNNADSEDLSMHNGEAKSDVKEEV